MPLGKIEKCTWKMGKHVRKDVGDDHVGDEDAEGECGQGQVEAAQAERGQGDQPAHMAVTMTPRTMPHRVMRCGLAASGEAEVEHDDRGDGPEGDRGQVDLAGVARSAASATGR